ncbi:hypothetical protein EIC73_18660 [Escherichia coli]|nr:hypothetical protein [Escherichia coli]
MAYGNRYRSRCFCHECPLSRFHIPGAALSALAFSTGS